MERKPLLLDLFCGAGGAAMGYHRAGFDVVGVDLKPQPRYPFEFIQGDAMRPPVDLSLFDVVHASPPCQGYTLMNQRYPEFRRATHKKLIPELREILTKTGKPFIIENVVGAAREMKPTLKLHGGMFGLGTVRPRLFETNFILLCYASDMPEKRIGIYGKRPDGRRLWGNSKSGLRAAASIEAAQKAMGIDWMNWNEIKESIPPAYTEFIGRQIIQQIVQTGERA